MKKKSKFVRRGKKQVLSSLVSELNTIIIIVVLNKFYIYKNAYIVAHLNFPFFPNYCVGAYNFIKSLYLFTPHLHSLSRSLTLLLILFSYERDKSQDFRMALAARSQMKDRVTLFIFFWVGFSSDRNHKFKHQKWHSTFNRSWYIHKFFLRRRKNLMAIFKINLV